MPSLGPLEILVIAAVALIVLGPERLPGAARSVGKALADLKRMAAEVRSEFELGFDEDEPVYPDVPASAVVEETPDEEDDQQVSPG